jgi:hypothetical protein
MAWKYLTAIMPSGSAIDTAWLNALGSNTAQASALGAVSGSWNLVQVVPLSNINGNGNGQVLCYFISGSY